MYRKYPIVTIVLVFLFLVIASQASNGGSESASKSELSRLHQQINALFSAGKLAEAQPLYQKVLEIQQKNGTDKETLGQTWENYGLLLKRLHHFDDAKKAFDRAEGFGRKKIGSPASVDPQDGRSDKAKAEEVDMSGYRDALQRQIKKHWFPPKGQETNIITVNFCISRDGALSDLRLSTSSKSDLANKAALNAVQNSAPFRPLPEGLKEPKKEFQFTFDYNAK